ncbi:uncharacterized protein LOC130899125 isoform X2 [Diorhabda carinulata]|nr:uncharacterized protein LOC130899125 isoform X2 [Diorhabda carinulata]
MDGKKFLKFCEDVETIDLTNNEKIILMGFMSWMNLNSSFSNIPSDSTSSASDSKRDVNEPSYLNMEEFHPKHNYVEYKNYPRISTNYFKYSNPNSSRDDIDSISYISNEYIHPLAPSQNRYDQITIQRIKEYDKEDLDKEKKMQYKVSYLEVIQPRTEIDGQIESDREPFHNSICGCACFWGCLQKRQK